MCITYVPKNVIVSSKQVTLLDFGLLQDRRVVAVYWKTGLHVWVKEMAPCVVMESLTYMTRGKNGTICLWPSRCMDILKLLCC